MSADASASGPVKRPRLAQRRKALDLGIELDLRHIRARTHDGLGRACQALGDADQARRHWQQALAIFTKLGVPEAEQVRVRLAASRDATA